MDVARKSDTELIWHSEILEFLPEKALRLPEHDALLLSDLHIGKTSHFRKNGIALSAKASNRDFILLKALLDKYPSRHVYFLGDLFHSEHNKEWEALTLLFALFPTRNFYLIPGNHDLIHPDLNKTSNFLFLEPEFQLGKLMLCHTPEQAKKESPTICGHIHPGYRLKGKGKQAVTLPAFYVYKHLLLLPAFGALTGLVSPPILGKSQVVLITPSGIRFMNGDSTP